MVVTYELKPYDGHIFVVRHVQNDAPNQEIVLNIRHCIKLGESNDQS